MYTNWMYPFYVTLRRKDEVKGKLRQPFPVFHVAYKDIVQKQITLLLCPPNAAALTGIELNTMKKV